MPKKFMQSFKYAKAGAQHVLRTQRNVWIHLLIGAAVIVAAIWLRVSLVETAVLALTIAFVIACEMFNTAIEETVNLIKPESHPLAALVKNISAGAVLAAAAGAIVVGLLIFVPRII